MIFQTRAISITLVLVLWINYYQWCSGFPLDDISNLQDMAPEKLMESGVKSAKEVAEKTGKLIPEEIAPEKLLESGVNAGTKMAEMAGNLFGVPLPTKFMEKAFSLFGEGVGVATNMIGTAAGAKNPVNLVFWDSFIRPSIKNSANAFADQF